MKENLIIRKRHLLSMTMLVMMLGLSGCAPQITTQTYTHEAGEELPADAAVYAEFKNQEQAETATVDVSKVDTDKVGTYEAAIMLNEREYPFTVEVVDTTAPDGTFDTYFITANGSITMKEFGIACTDYSKFSVGFRHTEIIMTEEELATVFEQELTNKEEILLEEVLGLEWNTKEDTWEEQAVSMEELETEFLPEMNGLYRLEMVATDEHGNATVMNCYVLADIDAPVLTGIEDTKITLTKDMELDNLTTNGVLAEDNLLGDITAGIAIKEEILEKTDDYFKAKITYSITDICGNEMVAERVMEFEVEKQVAQNTQTTTQNVAIADGYNDAWAYELLSLVNQARAENGLNAVTWDSELTDFARIRAQEASVKFSHERPDGTSFPYGENLAGNARSVSEVFNGWMNSEGHRANILHPNITRFGAACYCVNNKLTWAQIFY